MLEQARELAATLVGEEGPWHDEADALIAGADPANWPEPPRRFVTGSGQEAGARQRPAREESPAQWLTRDFRSRCRSEAYCALGSRP